MIFLFSSLPFSKHEGRNERGSLTTRSKDATFGAKGIAEQGRYERGSYSKEKKEETIGRDPPGVTAAKNLAQKTSEFLQRLEGLAPTCCSSTQVLPPNELRHPICI